VAESSIHLDLVRRILDHIAYHYHGVGAVAVLHDLPGRIGCTKPPKIGSYRPDVYAIDAPQTQTIVGEAKTQGDLETEHSHRQFATFLRFLALQNQGVFILGVPWQAKARGLSLLKVIGREIGTHSVRIVIVDDVLTNNPTHD
jgi:hypothetical protein